MQFVYDNLLVAGLGELLGFVTDAIVRVGCRVGVCGADTFGKLLGLFWEGSGGGFRDMLRGEATYNEHDVKLPYNLAR